MRKLDVRTLVVAFGIFGLGYAVCLAMPTAEADVSDPVVVDRLLVTDYIEIGDGVKLYGSADSLVVMGNLETNGYIFAIDSHIIAGKSIDTLKDVQQGGITIIGFPHLLTNVSVAPDVTGGNGLDVGKLGGYQASDFVLKSELPQCFKRCLEMEPPPLEQ